MKKYYHKSSPVQPITIPSKCENVQDGDANGDIDMEQINTTSNIESINHTIAGDFQWFYYDEDILYEKLIEVGYAL